MNGVNIDAVHQGRMPEPVPEGLLVQLVRDLTAMVQRQGEMIEQLLSKKANAGGGSQPRVFHMLGDERLSVQDLAKRAGCGAEAMRARLKTMTPEQAVAAGAKASFVPKQRRYDALKVHRYQGELKSIAELAALAGCTESAMSQRLSRKGGYMTPEDAVAAGARKVRADRKPRESLPGRIPGSAANRMQDRNTVRPTAETAAFAKDAEAITPANVKRIDHKTPPGRYAVEVKPGQGLFSSLKPGQYPDDSHMMKVYGAEEATR